MEAKHASGSKSAVLAKADQSVSFAELFFDLVFVYAITQVVHLMHGEFDWVHIGRSIIVFWLVWWAWTQFTWALNAANTLHPFVLISSLAATALAFFMAVSLPQAFSGGALYFAGAYIAVRFIGLLIYFWVTWQHEGMRQAVKMFSLFSIGGLIAVLLGGILGGIWSYWFWGMAILLDVIAATLGARSDAWNLYPKHFSERHGLFVIIALGETLIIAASGVTEEFTDMALLSVSFLSIGITCCLWWLYFYCTKDDLEHAMVRKKGAERSSLARDVFSLIHFPILCGLIIYAFAIEQAMHHPKGAMAESERVALTLGVTIFGLMLEWARWRATGKVRMLLPISVIILSTLIFFLNELHTVASMGIMLGGLLVICFLLRR